MIIEHGNKNFKEPWLAVILSSFLMGIGQIYSGRKRKGYVLLSFELALCFLILWSALSCTVSVEVGAVLFLLFIVIRIWNLFDAHKCAKKVNTRDFEITRKESKDPWLAVFLSYIIPGLGQFYIRRWFWGLLFLIGMEAIGLIKKSNLSLYIGLSTLFEALVYYHAYFLAPIRRHTSKKLIFIATMLILFRGFIVFPIVKYIVQPYKIATASMEPAILIGDRILVRKLDYLIKRADVIMFKPYKSIDSEWAKRVIAFGGEQIEIRNGNVYIDGEKLNHLSVEKIKYKSKGKFAVEGKPFIVPENSVFVLGDNSENSLDSRHFGPVPEAKIVGKVSKRFWPLNRVGFIK